MSTMNPDKFARFSGGPESYSDYVFGFLDDEDLSSENSCNYSGEWIDLGDFVEEDVESCNVEENKAFWDSQNQLLQNTLRRTSSIETNVRRATKEALNELRSSRTQCWCPRPLTEPCRSCLRREISDRLKHAGYDSAVCKSNWKSSPEIPSGKHSYIEVVDSSNPKRGLVRVIIEINFRPEFEMSTAGKEYNQLIDRLPEVFVGKAERLKALIKILCSAAKKCMKDKKMHIAPWRKQKYMQAKWFSGREQAASSALAPLVMAGISHQKAKPRASMLTFDFVENIPSMQCNKALEVV